MKYALTTLLSLLLIVSVTAANKASVGVNIEIADIEIAGDKVEPVPRMDSASPLVLRISRSKKSETGYIYSFRVEGYEPGDYNLCDYLQRVNGKLLGSDVEEIPFHVDSVLEAGVMDVKPPKVITPKRIDGYTLWLKISIGFWIVVPIIFLIVRMKRSSQAVDKPMPPTLADRIAPMVQQAANGTLNIDDRAALERMVLGHWLEKKPELNNLTTAAAIKRLRADEAASPLLLALEKWLHSPQGADDAEIGDLLAPYAEGRLN